MLFSLFSSPRGVSGVRAGEQINKQRERKKTPHLCDSVDLFIRTQQQGALLFLVRIFHNKTCWKRYMPRSVTSFLTAKRALLFWCNIWRPGTEGNPIILCRGARPTLPPGLWSDDLAGINVLFRSIIKKMLEVNFKPCLCFACRWPRNKSDILIVWNLRPLKPQNHVPSHQSSKLHAARPCRSFIISEVRRGDLTQRAPAFSERKLPPLFGSRRLFVWSEVSRNTTLFIQVLRISVVIAVFCCSLR